MAITMKAPIAAQQQDSSPESTSDGTQPRSPSCTWAQWIKTDLRWKSRKYSLSCSHKPHPAIEGGGQLSGSSPGGKRESNDQIAQQLQLEHGISSTCTSPEVTSQRTPPAVQEKVPDPAEAQQAASEARGSALAVAAAQQQEPPWRGQEITTTSTPDQGVETGGGGPLQPKSSAEYELNTQKNSMPLLQASHISQESQLVFDKSQKCVQLNFYDLVILRLDVETFTKSTLMINDLNEENSDVFPLSRGDHLQIFFGNHNCLPRGDFNKGTEEPMDRETLSSKPDNMEQIGVLGDVTFRSIDGQNKSAAAPDDPLDGWGDSSYGSSHTSSRERRRSMMFQTAKGRGLSKIANLYWLISEHALRLSKANSDPFLSDHGAKCLLNSKFLPRVLVDIRQ